jgi:hypothetical protein
MLSIVVMIIQILFAVTFPFFSVAYIRQLLNMGPMELPISTMIADLKKRKGIEASEQGLREQCSHAFNPFINEGFFADKVVIVEGPSEQYVLPIYAEALDYDFNRHNLSVVHAEGKGQMDRLWRVFNGFNIPTYLWFDGDKEGKRPNRLDRFLLISWG